MSKDYGNHIESNTKEKKKEYLKKERRFMVYQFLYNDYKIATENRLSKSLISLSKFFKFYRFLMADMFINLNIRFLNFHSA